MTLAMFDSIDVANLPPGADAYAGYVDGRWVTVPALKVKFPHAHILSVAVFPADDADCLDVETGDATIPEVYDWFVRQRKRGLWRPCVYTGAANLRNLMAAMAANGIARKSWRCWSAHYGAGKHICGPSTCGYPQADGTQFTDSAPGLHGSKVDESLLPGDFFDGPPAPPTPAQDPVVLMSGGDDMALYLPVGKGATVALNVPADASELQAAPVGPSALQVMLDNSGKWADWQVDSNRSPNPLPLGAAKVVRVMRADKGTNLVTVNWA